MRESCTSGTVGGEGGNILVYPAPLQAARFPEVPRPMCPPGRSFLRLGDYCSVKLLVFLPRTTDCVMTSFSSRFAKIRPHAKQSRFRLS
jgi:hypothetical protein